MVVSFLQDIIKSRHLLWALAKRDYHEQNRGAYLGVLWNYIQPLLFIVVLYSVFTLGFRVGAVSDTPFAVYLVVGMVCWLYFVGNLNSMASVIRRYDFMVKKVDFRLSILPLVKIVSSFFPHLILLCIAVVIAAVQGYWPGLHLLQLVYYFVCMVILLVGIGWLTSSTSIFIKDVNNVVGVIAQFGFWLTPIFWRMDMMPESIQDILKINPVYYIVTGYRDSVLSQRWFWERPEETLYFWLAAIPIMLCGIVVFKKLKPHFAEVI